MGNNKTCGCCDVNKGYTQFYKSPMEKKKYLPICKLCCSRKFKVYKEQVGNELGALWLILSELGVPVFHELLNQVKAEIVNAAVNTDIVAIYLRCLNESGLIVHGFWESDVMLDMLVESDVDREKEIEALNLDEEQIIWGKYLTEDGQLDIDAYRFLNQTMEDYTKDLLEIDVNLEKRYRDLAKAEFRKRKADESGDIQEIAKAQDNLKKILDMLKLSDFQNNNNKSEEEKHIERLIWNIENTKPAECEDLEKYKDFSNFDNTWENIMRCVRNLICGTRDYPNIPGDGS